LLGIKGGTAPGASGISKEFLLEIRENEYFIQTLQDTFGALINCPEMNIPLVPELFEFITKLIPK